MEYYWNTKRFKWIHDKFITSTLPLEDFFIFELPGLLKKVPRYKIIPKNPHPKYLRLIKSREERKNTKRKIRKPKEKKPSISEYPPKNKEKKPSISEYTSKNKREAWFVEKVYRTRNAFGSLKFRLHNDPLLSEELEKVVKRYLIEELGLNYKQLRASYYMKKYRKNYPICEECNIKKSSYTHHITPVAEGGKEKYENYKALCNICHAEKHPDMSPLLFP